MNGALWPRVVLAGALLLLVGGLVELFRARFATGDVYPAYSSLRSDPLGTRVFYEALGRSGIEVSRNFRDVARADPGRATIFLCGMDWFQLAFTETKEAKALLDSVRAGSRLVMAFAPQDGAVEGRFSVPYGGEPREDGDGRDERKRRDAVMLAREFGVDARWLPADRPESREAVRVEGPGLPERIPWHTALAFEPSAEGWRRVYEVGRYAGVLERDFGAGTIVLLGDAYLVSNEALARARHSPLLAWLVGPHRRAVFDETHLGVVENSGIAALARRYGLGHAAAGLLVVALLHLWRMGSSLVPPSARGDPDGGELAGRDASSGLVHLLRRTLPPSGFVATCLSEYKRSAAWRRLPDPTRGALEALAAPRADGRPRVLETLRAAHDLLKRKP